MPVSGQRSALSTSRARASPCDLRVTVEGEQVASARGSDAGVEAAGVAAILLEGDDAHRIAEPLPHERDRAVARAVVDDDELDSGERLAQPRAETQLQVLAPVPVHDDDGHRDGGIVGANALRLGIRGHGSGSVRPTQQGRPTSRERNVGIAKALPALGDRIEDLGLADERTRSSSSRGWR
jgi:hypothetical protein